MATTAPDRDRPNVVALPPLIYLGFLVLGLLADLIWPTRIASLSVRLAVGGLLFAAGLVLAAWALALLIPTLAVIRYGVIAREEEYLERKFGEAYRRYRSVVRRWL